MRALQTDAAMLQRHAHLALCPPSPGQDWGTALLPVLLSTRTQLPKLELSGNFSLELQQLGF